MLCLFVYGFVVILILSLGISRTAHNEVLASFQCGMVRQTQVALTPNHVGWPVGSICP